VEGVRRRVDAALSTLLEAVRAVVHANTPRTEFLFAALGAALAAMRAVAAEVDAAACAELEPIGARALAVLADPACPAAVAALSAVVGTGLGVGAPAGAMQQSNGTDAGALHTGDPLSTLFAALSAVVLIAIGERAPIAAEDSLHARVASVGPVDG
jgi:hypothetical protein